MSDYDETMAQTSKAVLPEKVRKILEEKGVLSPPKLPNPRMPKLDELRLAGAKKGLGFRLICPEPDDEAEPEDQAATATFFRGAEVWEDADAHPAVAAATALAGFLEETEPSQAPLAFGAAAD